MMEEKEFRQKVMPLQRMMYALALKLGLPPDDAADAVQETQLRLWRGREGLPED
ncbi:MAG: RNA polymerase subunit sigma-70, partial [Muribaculaceae bacterium]|nr:RNA polymerase subunit sigma-70 [Muribaculaceae bacterium]